MSKRRSRFELYVGVLEAIYNGHHKPTQIMYNAGLSWMSITGILANLVERELIREIDSDLKDKRTKNIYCITQKGVNVVSYYRKAKDLVTLGKIH